MKTAQADVIVIGGGAAGMLAAGHAAARGRRVVLLEKNPVLGKKLSMSGGGRCNITNAETHLPTLLQHYGEAADFLLPSFLRFGVKQTMDFFAQRGLPLVEQANKRVFPKTERAKDVVRVLQDFLSRGKVEVRLQAEVRGFVIDQGKVTGVRVGDQTLMAESYILATGGRSHPETGSTGDGFRWLADLGLRVHEPTPALVPLAVEEPWIKSLTGNSFDRAEITFFVDGEKKFSKTGRILCTHFGLSGPLILNTATQVADLIPTGQVTAKIDAVPDMTVEALDAQMKAAFARKQGLLLVKALKAFAPFGMSAAILRLIPSVDPGKKVYQVTKEERRLIAAQLKSLPATITGLMGFDRAIIVDGGLALGEVDERTMRVRRYPNVFVTGDVLHINRPSGGYSLQLCWTTGFVAGTAA